jgi:hypothetical protein
MVFSIAKLLQRRKSSGGDSRRDTGVESQSSRMEPITLPIVIESAPLLESLTPEVAAAIKQLNVDPVSLAGEAASSN